MITGIILGVILSIIVYRQLNPCHHDKTRYVMKCNDCGRIVGDIDELKYHV